MSRTKKLAKNTVFSLLLQVVTVISSFVVPKLILLKYGSEVNGLINSISQFLQIVSFLELGVGAVVQSALYRPLAEKNEKSISEIITSADRFFRRIGIILVGYVCILVVAYPILANQSFGYIYTAVLIIAMSISSFAQYYFGIVDQLLLTADQRGYIFYISSIVTILLNTIVSAALILMGQSIQTVKIMASVIFLARPLVLRFYINKRYNLDRHITYQEEPIKQKWNGLGQHIAGVILDHTDTLVLTVFSSLSSVSIYSVYHMVIYGVKILFISMTNGVQALLGELYAIDDDRKLGETFDWVEWVIHTGVVFVFGCTAVLIIPFIQIYTLGVTDANYTQPLFSAVIVLAHAVHCLRLPYHILIKAAGRYKETQRSYLIAAGINVIISIVMASLFGLVGVAMGTLFAMLYQTIWMVIYNSKHLLMRPVHMFLKQIIIDLGSAGLGIFLSTRVVNVSLSYWSWIKHGVLTSAIFVIALFVVNLLFNNRKMMHLFSRITAKIRILRK